MDEIDNKDVWIDQVMSGELKEAINLFVWQWGHPKLTLGQAERMAIDIFNVLSREPKENEHKCHESITVNVENFLKS